MSRCVSPSARSPIGAHAYDAAVHAVSKPRASRAIRPGIERGNGSRTVRTARATSAQTLIAATRRGLSKKPPEKKASAVGPARSIAVPRARRRWTIARQGTGDLRALIYTRAVSGLANPGRLLRSGIQRGALLALALAAVLWLGGSLWSLSAVDDGVAAVQEGDSATARQAFDRARTFGADAEVAILEATALVGVGESAGARTLAAEATRLEPESFDAWFTLYAAAAARAPATADRARRKALALNPTAAARLEASP